MSSSLFEAVSSPKPSIERVRMVLAAPLLLLLLSSFITWFWRALGLPGTTAGVSPLAALIIVAVLLGGVYATHRRLPLSLFTWFPSALASMVLLGGILALEGTPDAASLTSRVLFPVVFVFAMIISVIISKSGTHYGVAFAAIVFLAQVGHRFPIFAFDAAEPIDGANMLTSIAALRSILEIAALLMLVNRLILKPNNSQAGTAALMVILVLLHGPLTGWEGPLLSGENLTWGTYFSFTFSWVLVAGFSMGAITLFSRLRRSWVVESEKIEESRMNEIQRPEDKFVGHQGEVITETSGSNIEAENTASPGKPQAKIRERSSTDQTKRAGKFRRHRW